MCLNTLLSGKSVVYRRPTKKAMKFVQFTLNKTPGEVRVGFLYNRGVVDLCCLECSMPRTMVEILKYNIADNVRQVPVKDPKVIPLDRVTLMAPITGGDKVLAVAHNYTDFCEELGIEEPKVPCIFGKFPSTIIGPNDTLKIRTAICEEVDWQINLALVIGRQASSVSAEDAHKYIFGYTIAQDITERDWLKNQNGTQYLLGKSQDTFCPLGPYIITSDEVGNVDDLGIRCKVNGETKQRSSTSKMIYKIPAIIERISTVMTLYPGDVILTGTPAGIGAKRNPPEFLKPGDVIRSEIENIGALTTKVVEF